MRVLEKFPVLLLDMNGTFMFGEDRFSADEDFYQTYCLLGGASLTPAEVTRCIRQCFDGMAADYSNPACYDDFPSVREGLRRYAQPPEAELSLLEMVFARHERGLIPDSYAALLRRLARTHQLGLVTNIWATKELWLAEFVRAGVSEVFRSTVFSSDSRSIKPSPVLYCKALAEISATPEEALFIGDNLRCDIAGAKQVGIATAWITNSTNEIPPSVNYVLTSLHDLETLAA